MSEWLRPWTLRAVRAWKRWWVWPRLTWKGRAAWLLTLACDAIPVGSGLALCIVVLPEAILFAIGVWLICQAGYADVAVSRLFGWRNGLDIKREGVRDD